MKTIGKQTCPCCGRSVNLREINIYSGMVEILIEIHKWCTEKGIHEFKRKDISHLIKGESATARFGDWVYFGGLIYRPKGETKGGLYGMNMERVEQFLKGEYKIPAIIIKNPLTKEIEKKDYRSIYEIPNLTKYLDDNMQYITRYRDVIEI